MTFNLFIFDNKMLKHLLILIIINYSLNSNLDELNKAKNKNNIKSSLFEFSIGKIIIILFVLLSIYIIYTAIRNTSIVNKTIEEALNIIKKKYKLKEIDVGELKKITFYKFLSFYSKVYYIDEIGVLSILTVNIGIMQMITFNVNPFEKDLPLLSLDFIYIFSKRKVIVEVYGLMLDKQNEKYKKLVEKYEKIKEKNENLKPYELKKLWYWDLLSCCISNSGTVENEIQIFNIFKESVENYIDYVNEIPDINKDDKEKKYLLIKNFSDKLIEKGGVSADVFKKALGIEKTRDYFGKIVFGYLQYKEKNNNN